MAASLFPFFLGYPDGFPTSTGESGGIIIESPNVRLTARTFFDCDDLQGGAFEDDGPRGGRDTHWEERIFDVRPPSRQPHTSHALPALTPTTSPKSPASSVLQRDSYPSSPMLACTCGFAADACTRVQSCVVLKMSFREALTGCREPTMSRPALPCRG